MPGPRWSSLGMPLVSEMLSQIAARDIANDRVEHTVRVLNILSLTFASISILSTLLALYWFGRMRRSFRHELILLLVQSDCLKSMATVIFPIVTLVRGEIRSDSAFCQASGFVLSVGIESADMAVLLIALHSVMYLFRPRSGLYPYRHIAYAVFYLFPVTTACLAFIGGNGYENVGHYCYLRNDLGWTRLSLSWVPRYIVCVSIVAIYAFIYIYIRKRMGDYGRRHSEVWQQRTPRGSHSTPTTCRLFSRGRLPSAASSRRTSAADTISALKARHGSASSTSAVRPLDPRASTEV
ncbi:hypothetical protein BT67DRAFT_350665, partial [Trichocladium antarcticum]